MKGLVKYDLMQLAGTSKRSFYLLYFVGLAAVGVMLGGGTIFSYMAVMIGCMTGVSFFSYESWYHWDSYCAVMPLSNRQYCRFAIHQPAYRDRLRRFVGNCYRRAGACGGKNGFDVDTMAALDGADGAGGTAIYGD